MLLSGHWQTDTHTGQVDLPGPLINGCCPLPSSRLRLSCDDCQEGKRQNYQNCSALCCVRQLYRMICTYIWTVIKYECWLRFRFSFLCICLGLAFCVFLLGEEAQASPSIANTLWRVWTMFTRSAITTPEVNGFGWNLGNSEYIVWSCPWQILGAIRAEAEAWAEILFFFVD